jgi:hypothetical protein
MAAEKPNLRAQICVRRGAREATPEAGSGPWGHGAATRRAAVASRVRVIAGATAGRKSLWAVQDDLALLALVAPARAAVERVGAGTAEDPVVARLSEERVVSVAPA